jgi:transposase
MSENYKREEWLRSKYIDEEMTMREIADEADVYHSTIVRWCDRYNIKSRGRSETTPPHKRGYDVSKEELQDLYWNELMSMEDISERFNVDSSTINRWFKIYDIETREHYEWRLYGPAKYRTIQKGYESVRTTIDGSEKSMYVHRLVAIAKYGIDDVKDKHVHHKNHIPWDNRYENITLMTPSEHSTYHAGADQVSRGIAGVEDLSVYDTSE